MGINKCEKVFAGICIFSSLFKIKMKECENTFILIKQTRKIKNHSK